MPEGQGYTISKGSLYMVGRLVACKCGRKILAEASAYQPRDLPRPTAICLDCVVVTDEFRAQSPDAAATIDRWKAEARSER
jgi:hypothetical protein